jgi:DNA-binding MarR family transcriptional regulator
MSGDTPTPTAEHAVDAHEAIERELSLLLRRWRAYHLAVAEEVQPDLSISTYVTLLYILKDSGVRAADIAAYYGVDKGAVSRQIGQLEALGLITRGAAPGDGRAQLLVATAHGRQRFEAARSKRSERVREKLAEWDPRDVSAFALLLARFNSALDD